MPAIPVILALAALAGALATPPAAPPPDLPIVRVTADNAVIDRSCRVEIPQGSVIADADGNGVIHVAADNVTVEFVPGSVLRGAPAGTPQDALTGTGVRVDGHAGVTLRGLDVRGFKAGVHASRADGLLLEGSSFSGNFAQRLRSTPAAEDPADWLWPHRNDGHEWLTNYGAAVYVEASKSLTVRDVTVRAGQNGVLLDRVKDSQVYGCDCSFLSGWGLGMWRSSKNVVTRNAFDFCVRGYSHGVYNRGQDSAGILIFEGCCGNTFAENSATHSGDGVFGFAGRDALGEAWAEAHPGEAAPEDVVKARARAGCNDNLFIGNDLSDAPAHGLEMTFSFGNRIIDNRFAGNAICGVWGGYSAGALIARNHFAGNGAAGYGDERGAINIEHGRDNLILDNDFAGDALGVALTARPNPAFMKLAWGLANAEDAPAGRAVPSARNTVARNRFAGVPAPLKVRDSLLTTFVDNTIAGEKTAIDTDAASAVLRDAKVPPTPRVDRPELPAVRSPVGARDALKGREHIVMLEWGPWDHASAALRPGARKGGADVIEVFGAGSGVAVPSIEGAARVTIVPRTPGAPAHEPDRVRVEPDGPGVWPYRLRITADDPQAPLDRTVSGTLVSAEWRLTAFPWTTDPVKDPGAWRAESRGPKAITAAVGGIDLALGRKGPSRIDIAPEITAAGIGPDRYGLVATTTLRFPKGRWAVRTLSDDGVRVLADGRPIIERWDIHGPTRDEGIIDVDRARDVSLAVEYFQNDGHAVLSVHIEPAPGAP